MPKKQPLTQDAKQHLANKLHEGRMALWEVRAHINRHIKQSDDSYQQIDAVYRLLESTTDLCRENLGLPKPILPRNK
jgi:hypothetical protein